MPFGDPNGCWTTGRTADARPDDVVAFIEAELATPTACGGAARMTATVTTRGVASGAAASTRDFFSAIRFSVSPDARSIGALVAPSAISATDVSYTLSQPLVGCALDARWFFYVNMLFENATYTFVEVAFAPRLAAETGRPIDLSPQPSARIELCGDLRPSGA